MGFYRFTFFMPYGLYKGIQNGSRDAMCPCDLEVLVFIGICDTYLYFQALHVYIYIVGQDLGFHLFTSHSLYSCFVSVKSV